MDGTVTIILILQSSLLVSGKMCFFQEQYTKSCIIRQEMLLRYVNVFSKFMKYFHLGTYN